MAENQIYLGNPNLKKANVPTHFTPEQVGEFIKCSKNPAYSVSYTHLTLPTNREV